MDAPITGYVQYEEDGADYNCKPVSAKPAGPRRGKPYSAEYSLLAEFWLRYS